MTIVVFLIIVGLMVVAEFIYYRRHAFDDIDLDVQFSRPIANHGEIIEVIEVSQNNKRLPLPFLLLKFESPMVLEFQDMTNTSVSDYLYREDMLTMKPYSKHTRTIKARCSHRGYYAFARVNITTADLLLMAKLTKEFPSNASITILPELVDPSSIKTLLSVTFSEVVQRRTLLTDPFTFAGIRDYQPWDPMKSINWTATAKAGDFMVNTNASTSMKQVSIYVNLEYYNMKKSDSLLEKSISLAYSYILELSKLGIPTALYTNGMDILNDTPVISRTNCDLSNVSQRGIELARIDLKKEVLPFPQLLEENAMKLKDEFIVVISPKYDGSFIPALLRLKSHASSMLWVMPAYKASPKPAIDSALQQNYFRWEVLGHD